MTAGRPPLYKTPEEMQRIIDLYYFAIKNREMGEDEIKSMLSEKEDAELVMSIDDIVPTVSGLAYVLGMTTEAFRNYEQKDEFLATVKKAKQRVEMSLEQRLAGNAVTGSIFNLKNNFGWKDKTEQDINLGLTDLTDEQLDARLRALNEQSK